MALDDFVNEAGGGIPESEIEAANPEMVEKQQLEDSVGVEPPSSEEPSTNDVLNESSAVMESEGEGLNDSPVSEFDLKTTDETVEMPKPVQSEMATATEPLDSLQSNEQSNISPNSSSNSGKADKRNAKLDAAINSANGWFKRLLSTKNGKIGIGIIAAALIIAALFTSHVICFHDWMDATCTKPQICKKCGRTQGEALGHDWQEATCTKPKTCARCGRTDGAALGHDVQKWEVTKEATCTTAGEESGTCERCGEVRTREIAMLPHSFGDWETVKPASCVEEGSEHRVCKDCGKEEVRALPKVDHKPGDWEITKKAEPLMGGGSSEGEKVRRCTVCGEVLETTTYTLSDEELKKTYVASCSTPSFEDVARYPDDWEGKKVAFRGEVIQVMQDGDDYTLRVNVTDTGYYWTDTIMVYYEASKGAPRILEDDVMTFYGAMAGMYSYESVMGATITVPLMLAVFVD